MDIRQINLSYIRRDGGTQARAEMNYAAIDDYAQAMGSGAKFPPVVLFQDQDIYWLGDGFHRVEAAAKAGKKAIQAEIRQGGQRQARLFALGANATHGVRRTNADKRLAVSILLDDPEWSQWSNRKIADAVGVSDPFVMKMREERVLTVSSSSKHDVSSPSTPDPKHEATGEDEPLDLPTLPIGREDALPEPERQAALEAPPAPKAKLEAPADLEALKAENAELKDQLAELADNMTGLQEELAAARRILDAEDLLAQFNAEVSRVNAMNGTLKSRNFGLMDENNDLKGRLKSALRKIERLEKAAKGAA